MGEQAELPQPPGNSAKIFACYMIEDRFDIPFVAEMALREKQVQQNYRPIIAVHKWFARRPGTLFRGLLLAEFGDTPVADAFTQSQQFNGRRVADPFMGGGTPLIEANRLGCDVLGYDINPMAYWIVRQELEHLDLALYRAESERLVEYLRREIGHLFKTRCKCGRDADVKYLLWVKQQSCPSCGLDFDLWPGMLMAKDTRHTANVIICRRCGELNERRSLSELGQCDSCKADLEIEGNASRNKTNCPHCGESSRYPLSDQPPRHRLHAIEYHCEHCRPSHRGRFFKKPDDDDLAKVDEARERLAKMRCRFVPNDLIPEGDESTRLRRWGYKRYRELFNDRQIVGLELSARWIAKVKDDRVRNALATNFSDLLRYQNMLCRYDTMALKSLDIFSIHGFPVSLVQCESNLLGIAKPNGGSVGSGGWTNIIDKFSKAKAYCDQPFETIGRGSKKRVIYTEGEWIGDRVNGTVERRIDVRSEDSATAKLRANSLDAVLTDPPYFGMVQYAELMDFCYVWLRRLVGKDLTAFEPLTTRNGSELTGNQTSGRGLDHFAEGVSKVYRAMAKALRPGAPLAFTYHHNKLTAYAAIGVAILDAGLPCTAALPCPAEMGGSIHIANTGSSILDTVFVCRKGVDIRVSECPTEAIADALARDIVALEEAGYSTTDGDRNCLINGHTCREVVNRLLSEWSIRLSVHSKLELFNSVASDLIDRAVVIASAEEKAAHRRASGRAAAPASLFDLAGATE